MTPLCSRTASRIAASLLLAVASASLGISPASAQPIASDLTFIKTDENGKPLGGAEFTIQTCSIRGRTDGSLMFDSNWSCTTPQHAISYVSPLTGTAQLFTDDGSNTGGLSTARAHGSTSNRVGNGPGPDNVSDTMVFITETRAPAGYAVSPPIVFANNLREELPYSVTGATPTQWYQVNTTWTPQTITAETTFLPLDLNATTQKLSRQFPYPVQELDTAGNFRVVPTSPGFGEYLAIGVIKNSLKETPSPSGSPTPSSTATASPSATVLPSASPTGIPSAAPGSPVPASSNTPGQNSAHPASTLTAAPGATSKAVPTAAATSVGDGDTLASTGTQATGLLLGATALLATGTGLTLWRRRTTES